MSIKTLILLHLVTRVFGISHNVTIDGLGTVIGLQETTKWSNRTIYSFRGIPFAEPPIGELRFRPPVSITTLGGTFDARSYGNVCPQNAAFGTLTSGEDCLSLNVYVPEVDDGNKTLPVMIWLHGGTFTTGFAPIFEPHFILEEDVILVVPQFRLGPLGLLCLQTDEIPGNVQFLDQIMAMQWVQDNIASFGGDPDQVTLFGQSSGAASVNLHQFSPLSKGLFHRVILHSGSAFSPWVMDYNPVRTATRIGSVVNCTQSNMAELAACFRALDVKTILDGFEQYLAKYTLDGLGEIGGHRAVIQTAGTKRFLEEDPSTLLAKSEYSKMPMIGGATKHDGSFALATYYMTYFRPLGLANNTAFLKYDMTDFVVASFGLTDLTGGISQSILSAYFEEDQVGDFIKMVPGLTDICSVLAFKAPVFKMMQRNSLVNTSYLYRFGYFGKNRALSSMASLPFETGVGHSDELFYLFPLSDLSDDDVIVAKRMVSLWTSFAITGEPTVDRTAWPPMSTAFGPYLIIDEEFFKGTNYLSEHTIALKEGMTAVGRSSAFVITPQSVITIAAIFWSIFRL